jgi:hypothetical protein
MDPDARLLALKPSSSPSVGLPLFCLRVPHAETAVSRSTFSRVFQLASFTGPEPSAASLAFMFEAIVHATNVEVCKCRHKDRGSDTGPRAHG